MQAAAAARIAGKPDILTATANGNLELVEDHIIANPASIHVCDGDGRSPIFIAAREGHADCLKLLLAAGGDVNKCINDGTSPIFIAAQNGHADCLKLLLGAGADPRSRFNGTSALDKAREKGHTECVRALEAALS